MGVILSNIRIIIIVITLFLLTNVTEGQLKQKVGDILYSDSLTQFEIKNDSLIAISQNWDLYKYAIKSDTLILRKNGDCSGEFEGVFKILNNNQDSLILLPLKYVKSGNFKVDTLKFISVKKRIIPIENFQQLIIEQYGYLGYRKLVVNNNKTVSYFNNDSPGTKANIYKLSDSKYNEFIDTLSKCLVFMIPFNKKMVDAYDETYTDFTVQTNGQFFKMTGIEFSKIHYTLYKYIMFNLRKPD